MVLFAVQTQNRPFNLWEAPIWSLGYKVGLFFLAVCQGVWSHPFLWNLQTHPRQKYPLGENIDQNCKKGKRVGEFERKPKAQWSSLCRSTAPTTGGFKAMLSKQPFGRTVILFVVFAQEPRRIPSSGRLSFGSQVKRPEVPSAFASNERPCLLAGKMGQLGRPKALLQKPSATSGHMEAVKDELLQTEELSGLDVSPCPCLELIPDPRKVQRS